MDRKPSVLHVSQCARRSRLSEYTAETLGSGDLRQAVRLPRGEDVNEWVAANVLDLFNQVALIYDLCWEDAKRFTIKGAGYPPHVEYRWVDPFDTKSTDQPLRCSSPQFAHRVLTWAKDCINNPKIFPVKPEDKFPKHFTRFYVSHIYRRLFRVYAIIFWNHFKALDKMNAAAHANTALKHFLFFSFEFGLLDKNELKPLEKIVVRLKAEYDALGRKKKR